MSSPDDKTSSCPCSSKGQKTEETNIDDSDSDDSDVGTEEEIRLYNEAVKYTKGFETDFSKLTFCYGWQSVDLEDDTWVDDPVPDQTNNSDFIATLINLALTKHNTAMGTNLKLDKVLRANFHLSAGVTFHLSFEVNDPSDGNKIIPYRAIVRHLPGDTEVVSCNPRPSF